MGRFKPLLHTVLPLYSIIVIVKPIIIIIIIIILILLFSLNIQKAHITKIENYAVYPFTKLRRNVSGSYFIIELFIN